jgi:hypothetical protein
MSLAMPHEKTTITFEVCGSRCVASPLQVEGMALGMLATASMVSQEFANLASAQFRNVTAERLVWREKPNLQHSTTWTSAGPYSPGQIILMMQFKKNISNDQWIAHMNYHGIMQDRQPNNLKNRKFGREAPQNFDWEQATVAGLLELRKNQNSKATPTLPKTNSLGCFGIPPRSSPNRIIISEWEE